MDYEALSEYLSPEVLKRMTIHKSGFKDDIDEDRCMLSDGTVITISKMHGGLQLPNGFLNNPYNISIDAPSLIIVKFKENDNDKLVRFKVSSFADLENQWKKYRTIKELGDIYGTIESIELTKDQMDANSNLTILLNQFLNIVLQDDIDVFKCDSDIGRSRYALISSIATNIVNDLIISKGYDSVYFPTLIRDDSGIPISIVDKIDKKFIIDRLEHEGIDISEGEEFYDDEDNNKE